MLDFQELDIDLPLKPVGEVVVEGVRQDPVDQLLDQFNQPVFLQLALLPQLDIDVLDLIGQVRVGFVQFVQFVLGGAQLLVGFDDVVIHLLELPLYNLEGVDVGFVLLVYLRQAATKLVELALPLILHFVEPLHSAGDLGSYLLDGLLDGLDFVAVGLEHRVMADGVQVVGD